MSNVALRGTNRRFRIRNPYRLASGNRWLQKAREVLHRSNDTLEAEKPSVIVEQPATPTIQKVDDLERLYSASNDPIIALSRIAEQLDATAKVLESEGQIRKLTSEEALSLRVCHSTVRKLCAVTQGISMYFPSDCDDEWTE
ncbi:hypothetical protein GZ77_14855 [Endozoicomonas montiporae]|uniref:Uncharacterized protein n=2 Tax=Endozoicomonas montiporae TaxID=1027273 RepID=A0A081N572_9GAMM|nr:hypothetical protein [Endozoicomonas montiporae]AMO57524.1 hypothetical protein EZMO1_3541 [Endozoicomonas montiporae CL-33]KEQ13595.1 hypothetical protein GZ77_14855 [Endozoicomonas montiporae]